MTKKEKDNPYMNCEYTPALAAEVHKKAAEKLGKKDIPTRVAILNKGAELTTGARNESYGEAVVNMQHFAGLLTAYFRNLISSQAKLKLGEGKLYSEFSYEFTGEDAAQIMVLAKLSRTANRGVAYHEDNYIDAATYSAMAGECAERER